MDSTDLKKIESSVIEITRVAGEKILDVYETAFDVQRKQDQSPVTEADLAAHEVIVTELVKLLPDTPILSEEGGDIPFAERQQWSCYWLVDPLDGTREFVKRNDEFTVNIALIENNKPVLGVVYAPVLQSFYFASVGNNAYKKVKDQAAQTIQVRSASRDCITVAGSRSHSNELINQFLQRLGNYELVSMGSSLKICMIAEGKADVYPRLGSTSEWDTAAAQCVLEQAGGALTDTELATLHYNTKDSLINPHFIAFGDKSVNWAQFL